MNFRSQHQQFGFSGANETYRTMKRLTLFTTFWIWLGPAIADITPAVNLPGQLTIQVKGIVCSFCAHGTEKNLARLDFLDPNQFGNGVLIDIETHRITLALKAGEIVRYPDIADAITRGGYDPVSYHRVIRGKILEGESGYLLECEDNGQLYALPANAGAAALAEKSVLVQAELSAEQARLAEPARPVPLARATFELVPR